MEIRTLSATATKEILGDELSFLVAYSSNGDTILYVPEGKNAKEMAFPMEYPPKEILAMTNISTVRAAGKCIVYRNGIPVCIPC
ncbi:MAG: hypothetical protein PHH59_00180 [Methylovulum sp.]|uniref:hypothetical protein n=1 Tax=Methylovulum sp. TaxID=1916980 RepID=UPI002639C016|nr:hypothetical protein [Methylovulum sp.]MDD2722424.1 hypothetical protein [Methylovulum sp.]MDD5124441.1 hypothetical protein [Methylovulum sp.]